MGPNTIRTRGRFAGLGFIPALFWAAVFAAAYGQAPLYFSNQNQYFLHGLAAAGRGDLAHDWLANTRDPAMVFSAGIAWIYLNVGEWGFYAVNAILQGIYFVSLVALIDATFGLPRSRASRFVLLTLLVTVHSLAARWASLYITGTVVPMYLNRPMAATDFPRYLYFGVAGQYLLGQGLQPSAFGVFLVTSMAAFARGRLFFAAIFAAMACSVHATYLLPAALLTLTYMMVLIRRGSWFAAIFLGIVTLAAVSPVAYLSLTTFDATTSEQHAMAQRLLVDVRIPHHAVVSNWFDRTAKFQITWVAFAMLCSMRTGLFPLLAIPAIISVLLTLVQVAPGNPIIVEWLRAHGVNQEILDKAADYSKTLALMFPWRISVVLVPVATAAIVTRFVAMLTPYPGRSRLWGWIARFVALILSASIVAGGLYFTFAEPKLMFPADDTEMPLIGFVESHRQSGDAYLVPVTELERFRIATGAPIYVDWKSIPYKDTEVLEWRRRIEQAQRWYANGDWDALHDELRREGVTHVVIPTASAPAVPKSLEREQVEGAYQLFRIRP